MSFYSLVFLLFIGSEPMGILQPSILIPLLMTECIDMEASQYPHHVRTAASNIAKSLPLPPIL